MLYFTNSISLLVSLTISIFSITHSFANELPTNDDVDYGQLYVIQKQTETEKKWSTTVTYGYGFSNPYLGIHSVQVTPARKIGEHVRIGVSPAAYFATTKDFTKTLNDELLANDIRTEVYRPRYALVMNIDLIPLNGMINFFSSSTLGFDLITGIGGGFINYASDTKLLPTLLFRVMPQFMFSKSYGMNFGLQSNFDRFSGGSWQNRLEATAGVIGRF